MLSVEIAIVVCCGTTFAGTVIHSSRDQPGVIGYSEHSFRHNWGKMICCANGV